MKYCIAVDGGGTKIDVVLFDETGHIIRRNVSPGGSALDIGIEEAQKRYIESLRPVVQNAPGKIAAIYGGIAGVLLVGDIYSELTHRIIDTESTRFAGDSCNLISGTLGHGDGCGMVCGTGSALFVRKEGQPLRHIGGKGYLIDTGGSGFELGRDALKMALRSVDERCGKTVLTELLEKRLGQPVNDSIIPMLHWGGQAYIASFAPVVFEGRRLGDEISTEIFEHHSSLLAELTFVAEKYFDEDFSVAMGGGIVNNFPEYTEAIVKKSSPRAKMILQNAPPVFGAAVEAMWDAGITVTEEIKANFLSDYEYYSRQSPQMQA